MFVSSDGLITKSTFVKGKSLGTKQIVSSRSYASFKLR